MLNKIISIGNLTKDPDVRYTTTGMPVTTMRIAVTSKYKQGDEVKDDTLFIDTVVFGRQAESCGQYLSKGNPIVVDGRLRERRWETDGTQRSKFEVIANNIKFLPKRGAVSDDRSRADEPDVPDTAPPREITNIEPF